MSERKTLSVKEIKEILDKVPKSYHLEIYRALKTSFFSPKTKKKDIEEIKNEISKYLNSENAPRALTKKEIDNILEVITLLPAPIKIIAEDNNRQLKNRLKRQLSKLKFSIKDDTIDKIKKEIRRQYLNSVCPAGESVGINSSTSIGQKLTQATLNTFHQSGSKNNQGGLGYMERLFRVSKPNEDIIITHFKDKNLTREEIKIIGNNLKGISIDQVKTKYEIIEILPKEDEEWYDNYTTVMGKKFIYKGGKFLRIYLNTNLCYQYDIFIDDIIKTIEYNTRSSEIRKTVNCIGSSTYKGIIDVHVEPEFIKLYITKLNEKVTNNKIAPGGDIDELSEIFLNVLLPNNFKDMIIKGIKGIDYVGISEGINLIRTFKESQIKSEIEMEKYSKKPYNLKLDDISRLWEIKVFTHFIYFEGISVKKYINLFESAGFKIIEDNLETTKTMIILLPKKLDVMFFDKDDKKVKPLFTMEKSGVIMNNETKKPVTNITPVMLIESKLRFIESRLINIVLENLENSVSGELPVFPELYRYAYYYHATIEGKNIIRDLMNNRLIDADFTYPDNVNNIYDNLGIEAARFYLINKYFQTKVGSELNPVNIELLADFQTGLGVLLPTSSTGVSKIGSSMLSSGSYEKAMYIFQEGSAFGTEDEIKGISGSIMTGSKCRNGTGFTDIQFSEKYIKDKANINEYEKPKDITMETDYLEGPCYATVPQDLNADYEKSDLNDNVLLNLPMQGKVSELCLKEDIPDPPRMEMPEFLMDILEDTTIDIEEEYKVEDDYKTVDLLDIPDNPGQIEEDFF